jgi:ATP synthase protein I
MAGANNQSGRSEGGRDGGDIRRRLDALGDKLSEAQSRQRQAAPAARQSQGGALGQALRLGVELVAGVAVGGFIGWGLDRLFGTAPLFMVLFLGLGATAGILNVVRTAKRMQAEAPSGKGLPSVKDDDDD